MNPKDQSIYPVILAGGAGTRFWPLSRANRPKQFLQILDRRSLFQETIRRIQPFISPKNIFIVANQCHRDGIKRQLKGSGVSAARILWEPVGKDTAPAICWAALQIQAIDSDAVMVVLPSDHVIVHGEKFQDLLSEAVALARQKYLVTMGIVPTRPETGYGYLQTKTQRIHGQTIFRVEKFTEKPDLAKAREFIRSKNYLWNGGIFVWKPSVILEEFKKYLPDIYHAMWDWGVCRAQTSFVPPSSRGVRKLRSGHTPVSSFAQMWSRLPSISIDYGLMEKSDKVVTVPARNLGWSDLGSWQALSQLLTEASKRQTNCLKGRVINIGGQGLFVLADKRLIATVGLRDTIVVDCPDALLICRKDYSQKVKDVVEVLQKFYPEFL